MLLNRLSRVVETIGHIYCDQRDGFETSLILVQALISWIHELDDFLKSL